MPVGVRPRGPQLLGLTMLKILFVVSFIIWVFVFFRVPKYSTPNHNAIELIATMAVIGLGIAYFL